MRNAVIGGSIENEFQWRQTVQKLPAHVDTMIASHFQFVYCEFRRLAETGDQVHRLGSGPPAALLPAAMHQGLERRAGGTTTTSHECADTFRRMNLVPADADEIDARVLERVDLFSEALRGIHMQTGIASRQCGGNL